MIIQKHIRLAGAVTVIVGALANHMQLAMIGLLIQYLGVISGLDRVEQILEEKDEKNDPA